MAAPRGTHSLPEPLPMAGEGSVCVENSCRACCFDTQMPLLQTDIHRLEETTRKKRDGFCVDTGDGPPRLKNKDGHCVFLDDTGCSVYDARPAGCRLYPLVMDPETKKGVLDDECPHTRGFRVRPKDRAALAELVDALGLDA